MSTTNNDVVSESSKQHRHNTKNTINPTVQVLEQIETDAIMECINMMHYLNTKISTILNDINNQPSLDTLNDIVREVSGHRETLAKCYDKVTSTAQSPTPAEVETMHTTTEQTLRTIETQVIQVLRITESKQTEQKVSVANERVTKPSRQLSRRSHKAKSYQCELERNVRQLQSEMADQQGEMEIQQIKDQLEQKRIKDLLEQKRIKDELEHQLEQKRIKDQLEQKRIKDELEQKRIKDQLEQKRINDQLEQKEKQHKMKLIQRQLDKATEELSIKLSGSNCSLSTSGDNLEDYSAQVTARYVYNHNNGDMSAPLHNTPVTHSPVSTDDKYIGNLNPSHSSAICNINDQPAGPRILNMQTHGTSNSDGQHSMPIQQTTANPLCKTDTYIWSHNNVDNIPSFRPQCNPTVQSSPLHAPFPPQTSADQNKIVPSQCYANATIPQYSSTTYTPPQDNSHQHDMATIAKLFADSISMNPIPVPEPIVFDGNTLDYPIWKASFETLTESKNIDPTEELVKHHMTNRQDSQCSLLQPKRKNITRQSQKYQLMDFRAVPASWKMILIILLTVILCHTLLYGKLSIVVSCTIRQYKQHCKLSWNEIHPYFEEPLICICNNSRLILNCHYIVKHPVVPPELLNTLDHSMYLNRYTYSH